MPHIGVDLGGTGVQVGIVDENQDDKIIGKSDSVVGGTAEDIMDTIVSTTEEAVKSAGLKLFDIKSIGVGTPGAVDPEARVVVSAFNLPFHDFAMGKILDGKFSLKRFEGAIGIGNDANVVGLAEHKSGAAKGAHSSVFVTLGTGYGGAYIDKFGNLLTGFNGAAAELGHLGMIKDGKQCTCGKKGCIEAYASVTGLIDFSIEVMLGNPDSKMWDEASKNVENGPDRTNFEFVRHNIYTADKEKLATYITFLKGRKIVNGRTAFDAMRQNDLYAKGVVENWRSYVAESFTTIINTFQPEILVVGGGIVKEPDEYLLTPIIEQVDQNQFTREFPSEKKARIVKAKFGPEAGIIGASYLARGKRTI